MPSLTVRSVAELLRLPAYNQTRILYDQKYPKQEPQKFRTPYYQPAVTAFRDFHKSSNDPSILLAARNAALSIKQDARRQNVLRVVDAFTASPQIQRRLTPVTNPRLSATISTIDIRLAADLRAIEGSAGRVIYYHCRQIPIDTEVAHVTTEIAHWILQEAGQDIDIDQIEVVDLAAKRVYKLRKRRPTTIRLLKNNAKIIEALWPSI